VNSQICRSCLPSEWRKHLRARETDFERARSSPLVCKLTSRSGREVWDRDGLWNGFFGERLINPEHRTEIRVLFTKPSAFLLHCFQALLNIVLLMHAAVHCYALRGRSYPRNEAIKQPILCPMNLRSPQNFRVQLGSKTRPFFISFWGLIAIRATESMGLRV
jgi:hypothetical protein